MTGEELIERLEGLSGPDREVDCWIGCLQDFTDEYGDYDWKAKVDKFGIEHALKAATSGVNVWSRWLPHYTASLDAGLALLEEIKPNHKPMIDMTTGRVELMEWVDNGWLYEGFCSEHKDIRIALLIAILKAEESGEC